MSSHIGSYRRCWDPAGCLGGRGRLGGLVPSLLGAAAARWGSAARSGAAARLRRGVPARAARNRRRESDPTPFWGAPGGDPAAHPTPNAQTPNAQNTQRSAVASPGVHLSRRPLRRRGVLDRGFKTCYRSPRKVTSSPTSCGGVTLPPKHPTPKTPNAQTPNARP